MIKLRTLSLFGALVAGGLVFFGASSPASAQFGPGFGRGPGLGLGPAGSFGGISVNLGIGRTTGFGHGCRFGCGTVCRHLPVAPVCPPVRPVCPPVPTFYGAPGFGYGSFYQEYRSGFGAPAPIGMPGFGRHPGWGW